MRQRIYIDNSVIGGYFDEEFEAAKKRLFDRIIEKDFDIYFSKVNDVELSLAPKHIQDIKNLIPKDCYNYLDLTDEANTLAETYVSEKVLGQSSMDDAYHIAIASVNRLDCLISWNFKKQSKYSKIVKDVTAASEKSNFYVETESYQCKLHDSFVGTGSPESGGDENSARIQQAISDVHGIRAATAAARSSTRTTGDAGGGDRDRSPRTRAGAQGIDAAARAGAQAATEAVAGRSACAFAAACRRGDRSAETGDWRISRCDVASNES